MPNVAYRTTAHKTGYNYYFKSSRVIFFCNDFFCQNPHTHLFPQFLQFTKMKKKSSRMWHFSNIFHCKYLGRRVSKYQNGAKKFTKSHFHFFNLKIIFHQSELFFLHLIKRSWPQIDCIRLKDALVFSSDLWKILYINKTNEE